MLLLKYKDALFVLIPTALIRQINNEKFEIHNTLIQNPKQQIKLELGIRNWLCQ